MSSQQSAEARAHYPQTFGIGQAEGGDEHKIERK
jgi:hypothetical protein